MVQQMLKSIFSQQVKKDAAFYNLLFLGVVSFIMIFDLTYYLKRRAMEITCSLDVLKFCSVFQNSILSIVPLNESPKTSERPSVFIQED